MSQPIIPPYRDRELDPKEQPIYESYVRYCASINAPAADPEQWRRTTARIFEGGGVDAP